MSYQALFTNRLSLSNFCKTGIRQWKGTDFAGPQHAVNVAQQSDEGGFSVQANRASCVLVRQKVFCPTRTNLPAQRGGGIRSKSRILEEKKVQTKNLMCMEKTTGTRTGRKPKNDPADHKYSFRLNAEENTRFEKLLADSGAATSRCSSRNPSSRDR